ncbi:hypothetical protein [Corynebacterium atypicum]|uniref:hypothetical protein n=1 Tax=Corynebacterium atypicum TaxID=191610 RepID=UPI0011866A1F|nr:hypothetical protein [Corynebacterium atypicum]
MEDTSTTRTEARRGGCSEVHAAKRAFKQALSAKRVRSARGAATVGACLLVAGLASGCAMLDPQGRQAERLSSGESAPNGFSDAATIDAEALEAAGKTLFGVPVERLPFGPGPFDPDSPTFEQFNPCTAIDHSIYQAAGLKQGIAIFGDEVIGGVAGCPLHAKEIELKDNLGYGYYTNLSSNSKWDQFAQLNRHITSGPADTPFQHYTTISTDGEPGCLSGIVTDKGRWEIIYRPDKYEPQGDDCQKAVEAHRNIIQQFK